MLALIIALAGQAGRTDLRPSPGFNPVGFYCALPWEKKKVVRRFNIHLPTSIWQDEDGSWYPIKDIGATVITLADGTNDTGRRVITLNRLSLELIVNTHLKEQNLTISDSYVCHTGPAVDWTEGRKF